MKRTFFIGDVHGCYDELIELCERIHLQEDDSLYFVGDLINKGPKSIEVVAFVRNRPNTWSVIGNHELYSLSSGISEIGQGNGTWRNFQFENSLTIRNTLKEHGHFDWLLSLPHIIKKENFVVVHGGLHPGYGLDTPKEIATLIRFHDKKPWYEYYTGEKKLFYGHWAAEGLRVRYNTIGLDTGCCFGGHLTAYCFETGEIFQVRANAVYKNPSHWI